MDPLIRLIPIIKLTGSFTVSLFIKLTFILLELFWIPIIKSKNKQKLNVNIKNSFLMKKDIYISNYFNFNTDYK